MEVTEGQLSCGGLGAVGQAHTTEGNRCCDSFCQRFLENSRTSRYLAGLINHINAFIKKMKPEPCERSFVLASLPGGTLLSEAQKPAANFPSSSSFRDSLVTPLSGTLSRVELIRGTTKPGSELQKRVCILSTRSGGLCAHSLSVLSWPLRAAGTSAVSGDAVRVSRGAGAGRGRMKGSPRMLSF